MIRAEIEALLQDFVSTQAGGYDGATEVVDDETEGRQRKPRIGF